MKSKHFDDFIIEGLKSISLDIDSTTRNELDKLDIYQKIQNANKFEIVDILYALIGENYKNNLQPFLVELKDGYVLKLLQFEKKRINDLLISSPKKGWNEWVIILSTLIGQFRDLILVEFCKISFPFPNDKVEIKNELLLTAQYISNGFWADAYNSVEYLFRLKFMPKQQQAELCTILGEIQEFRFNKIYKAQTFYNESERLAPEHQRVLLCTGNYFKNTGEYKKAKKYYSKLLKLYPGKLSGYIGMGEIARKESKNAIKWYKDAIKFSPGDYYSYIELAKYYIEKEIKDYHKAIEIIEDQILCLSPQLKYNFHIEIGFCFQKKGDLVVADSHYQIAKNFDSFKIRAQYYVGNLYSEITCLKNLDEARSNFEKIIEVFPKSGEGYSGMAYTFEIECQWQFAIDWNNKCPNEIFDYKDRNFAAKGRSYIELNNYKQAEKELLNSFDCDNKSQWAKAYMEILANRIFEKDNDREKAEQLYGLILKNIGNSYKPDYCNRIGNMCYYFSEYEKAIKNYKVAINLTPQNVTFHRNMAGALQYLKKYDEAEIEIEAAFRIDTNKLVRKQKLASLYNSKGNSFYSKENYNNAITEYIKATNLISDDDIYYSNLALAYEKLYETTSLPDNLTNAIIYFDKANEIKPDEEYRNTIISLNKKRKFVNIYGNNIAKRIPIITPIAIEVAADLIPLVESIDGSLSVQLQQLINIMRDEIQFEMGNSKVPGIRVRGNETDLPNGTYIIMINEIPLVSGNVNQKNIFVNESAVNLKLLEILGENTANPENGSAGSWISVEKETKVKVAGLQTYNILEYMILHLKAVIKKNFSEFVNIQNVSDNIREINYYQSILLLAGGVGRFTEFLKIFAEEEVAIKELNTICEEYMKLTLKGTPLQKIVEEIRSNNKILPLINVNRIARENNLEFQNVIQLDKKICKLIDDGINSNDDASILALEPEITQDVLNSIRKTINDLPAQKTNSVILVECSRIRRPLKKLLELEFPNIVVMMEKEIMLPVKRINTILLDG